MADAKETCRTIIAAALNEFIKEKDPSAAVVDAASIVVQNAPNPEMGDLGAPMFTFAKALRMAPPQIAAGVVAKITDKSLGEFLAVGPYVNVKLDKSGAAAPILKAIKAQGDTYGSFNCDGKKPLDGRRVMIEFSSPNTNKPLHLGHVRNDALGESVSRILKAAGAEVYKVDLINNRGVHICKSMLAYKLFHEANGDTPEKLGMKGDHFVGQCYVEFDKYLTLLFEIDSLVLNDDRHLNNIAVLEKGGKYDYCPIFDNGAGLLSNMQILRSDIEPKALIKSVYASPFHMTFNRELKTVRGLYGSVIELPKFSKDELKLLLIPLLDYLLLDLFCLNINFQKK